MAIDYRGLAKIASEDYLLKQVPLNTTIEKIASEESLNPNQITRVVEEANVMTYQALFEKNADKNFVFPLADSSEIVKSLNSDKTASENEEIKKNLDEYSTYHSILDEKMSKQHSLISEAIEEEKIASFSDRNAEERDCEYLKSASRTFELEKKGCEIKLGEVKDRLSYHFKIACLEHPISEVVEAIRVHTDGDVKVASALDSIWGSYNQEEITAIKIAQEKIGTHRLNYKVHPLDKGTIVNPDHPVLKEVDAYRTTLVDIEKSKDKKSLLKDIGMNVRLNERLRKTISMDDPEKQEIVSYQEGPVIEVLKVASINLGTVGKNLGKGIPGIGAVINVLDAGVYAKGFMKQTQNTTNLAKIRGRAALNKSFGQA